MNFWYLHDARLRLLDRDKCCVYCGEELSMKTASIDHMIPKSKGGSDDDSNLVLSCKACNDAKQDLMPLEFIMIRNGYWNRLSENIVVCW